jgi:putative chitinase
MPLSTKSLLDRIAERDTGTKGDGIAYGLDKYCPQYSINSPLRLAHFLAQACHETEGFRYLKEIWGPTPAQKRYEGRADLGNTRPGDGRLYCGRGIFQLTGRTNYARIGAALALPLEVEPELAADPQISVRIACHYWMIHSINQPADADNVVLVTRLINGGLNGLDNRKACLARAKELLL